MAILVGVRGACAVRDATEQAQLVGLESSDAYFAIPSYILVNQA